MLLWERASDWTDDPDCTYEIKYDGYRLMAQMCGGSVFLKTKNGADATAWFPEVVSGLSSLASSGTMVLDGGTQLNDHVQHVLVNLVAGPVLGGWPASVLTIKNGLHLDR